MKTMFTWNISLLLSLFTKYFYIKSSPVDQSIGFFYVNTFPPFTRFGFFVPFLLFPFSPCWFILLHVLKTFWSSRVIILSLFWFSLRHIHVPTFPSFVGVWGFVLASVIKQYIYIDETLPNFSFP